MCSPSTLIVRHSNIVRSQTPHADRFHARRPFGVIAITRCAHSHATTAHTSQAKSFPMTRPAASRTYSMTHGCAGGPGHGFATCPISCIAATALASTSRSRWIATMRANGSANESRWDKPGGNQRTVTFPRCTASSTRARKRAPSAVVTGARNDLNAFTDAHPHGHPALEARHAIRMAGRPQSDLAFAVVRSVVQRKRAGADIRDECEGIITADAALNGKASSSVRNSMRFWRT